MLKHILTGAITLIIGIAIMGCSNDKNPTSSNPIQSTPLAGGGRLTDNDPAGGNIGNSPAMPPFDSLSGLTPLFSSYIDCAKNPGEIIITNQADWEAWWQVANSCLYVYPPIEPWLPDSNWWDTMLWDTMPPDSYSWDTVPPDSYPWDTVPPDSYPWDSIPHDSFPWDTIPHDSFPWDTMPHDSYPWDTMPHDSYPWDTMPPDTGYYGAPPVNFDSFVVVVISLALDSNTFGRFIWVDEVNSDAGGTVVRYTVSTLGEDCAQILMRPMLIAGTEVIAVMAPRPIVEPVIWIRTDTVFNCIWEPDPNLPATLYYTDAPCELGSGETVFTDSASFAVWLATANVCDSLKLRYWYDSGFFNPTFPIWFSPEVDFTTHAVIILRSGNQTRWGGGIWLDRFDVTPSGTIIDYTVMEPGDDCWTVGPPLGVLNQTVAIRVPLPINLPITWNRNIQPIQCNWNDSTGFSWGGY